MIDTEPQLMPIGVKELRATLGRVLQDVHVGGCRYVVTLFGRPVALLVPIDPSELEAAQRAVSGENGPE